MDNIEKRAALGVMISPDTDSDEVLDSMIAIAESEILNRMYPFGYPENTAVPARYERIQIALAAEIYSKRGAEGQLSHSENGISRSWSEKSQLLQRIVPHVGSVITDA